MIKILEEHGPNSWELQTLCAIFGCLVFYLNVKPSGVRLQRAALSHRWASHRRLHLHSVLLGLWMTTLS